jgi:hypothetical protein
MYAAGVCIYILEALYKGSAGKEADIPATDAFRIRF